jgi:hypothetical protein
MKDAVAETLEASTPEKSRRTCVEDIAEQNLKYKEKRRPPSEDEQQRRRKET